MLFNFNEAWARVSDVVYDACICGTGPAGITTARKLASRGRRVILLEGGDLSYTEESQELYRGNSVGLQYWHVQSGRLRFFGGTSNHWSGRCGILDPIDFEERKYFGMPGWPISREQVLAHLSEAQDIVDIPGTDLSPYNNPEFASTAFCQSGFALSPPTRFSSKYEAELRRSERIDLFYNANLVDVRLNENRTQVDHLSIKSFNSRPVKVFAKRFILALGAIENARILLNANSQVAQGVGNHTGMVGRCFMEHLNVSIGRFLVTSPEFWKKSKDVALVPTEEFMRQNDFGNGILSFGTNASPQSYGRLRVFKQFLRETSCLLPNFTEIARKINDFDCPGDGLITSLIEQTPNPNSHVSLTGEVDRLGLRQIQLNWELNERDKRTIRGLSMKAAREMAKLNRARVQLAPFITNEELDIEVGGHAHQMGTTRMSMDPKFGVVNERFQIHGIENLYLIGSSVFPTGGGTNPTLTIVMLALNLATQLSSL